MGGVVNQERNKTRSWVDPVIIFSSLQLLFLNAYRNGVSDNSTLYAIQAIIAIILSISYHRTYETSKCLKILSIYSYFGWFLADCLFAAEISATSAVFNYTFQEVFLFNLLSWIYYIVLHFTFPENNKYHYVFWYILFTFKAYIVALYLV